MMRIKARVFSTVFILGLALFVMVASISGTNHAVAQSGLPLQVGNIVNADWNRDGVRIVTSHYENILTIWNARTGQPETTFSVDNPYLSSSRTILGMPRWNPEGDRLLAIHGHPGQFYLVILDGLTGEELLFIDADALVHDIAWSPDGSQIAASTSEGTGILGNHLFRVWDATTGELLIQRDRYEAASKFSWSPDGAYIAMNSAISAPTIWDVIAWTPAALELQGSPENSLDISWSPDGNWIASSGRDFAVRVWNTSTGNLETALTFRQQATNLVWSPDSTRIAIQMSLNVQIYDPLTGEPLTDMISSDIPVVWSPDSERLLVADEQGFTILDLFGD